MNDVPWSKRLLGNIVKKSDKWLLIGTYDQIYIPKKSEISNEIEFIEYVLQSRYKGAVKLKALKKYLASIHYSRYSYFVQPVIEAIENDEAPLDLKSTR